MNFTIEEIVKHPIQLTKVQLIEMNLQKFIFDDVKGEIHRDITISTDSQLIDSNTGYADVTMNIDSTLNNEHYYNLTIKYRGSCQNVGIELEPFELEYFLEVQAIKLIWPYFREILPGIMIKMGTECFDIPTMDVLETITGKKGQE